MSKMFNNYIGKAGQLFAMSEFLMRGWNVAIPEVDRGEDIFVVQDSDGTLRRVQVKSSQAKMTKQGYYLQFNIPYRQIVTELTPDIHFVLLVRYEDKWRDILLISRERLEYELSTSQVVDTAKTILRVNFMAGRVTCRSKDFTRYRNEFASFPSITH